jgi:5-(carboxyamino)imidazole ribonucleotide mutase
MTTPFVAVLMGSDSDLPVMQTTLDTLNALGVAWEVRITSAHRTPANTMEYVKSAEARGCRVFIAAAGLAAHLAGAVAAHTTCPVIGVPMDGGPLNGFDALLSTCSAAASRWLARGNRQGRSEERRLSPPRCSHSPTRRFAQKLRMSAQHRQIIAEDQALQEKLKADFQAEEIDHEMSGFPRLSEIGGAFLQRLRAPFQRGG